MSLTLDKHRVEILRAALEEHYQKIKQDLVDAANCEHCKINQCRSIHTNPWTADWEKRLTVKMWTELGMYTE